MKKVKLRKKLFDEKQELFRKALEFSRLQLKRKSRGYKNESFKMIASRLVFLSSMKIKRICEVLVKRIPKIGYKICFLKVFETFDFFILIKCLVKGQILKD